MFLGEASEEFVEFVGILVVENAETFVVFDGKAVTPPEAQSNITEAFLFIYARNPLNAARWLQGLYKKIDTLEQFPERCAYQPLPRLYGGGWRIVTG